MKSKRIKVTDIRGGIPETFSSERALCNAYNLDRWYIRDVLKGQVNDRYPHLVFESFEIEPVTNFCGKEGQTLSVVWYKGELKYNTFVEVLCSECNKDRVLFPEPFGARYSSLLYGMTPCACKKNYKYTKDQILVKILRECEKKSCVFLGFKGEFSDMQTKLKLQCSIHKENKWDTTSCSSFLNSKRKGCPDCFSYKQSVEEATKLFMESGEFCEDTIFKRVGGTYSYWWVYCPICAEDKYSEAGLCDGWFKSRGNLLKRGSKPCRCTKKAKLTKDMWDLRIKDCLLEGESYQWIDSQTIKIKCPVEAHLPYKQKISVFCSGKHRCRGCADFNFNSHLPSWFYLVTWKLDELVFQKIGITSRKVVYSRLKEQKNNTEARIQSIDAILLPLGQTAENLEDYFKRAYTTGVIDKALFRDGSTETIEYQEDNWDNILKHVKGEGYEILKILSE